MVQTVFPLAFHPKQHIVQKYLLNPNKVKNGFKMFIV